MFTGEKLLEAQFETNRKLERLLSLTEKRLARVEAREQREQPKTRFQQVQEAVRALNLALGLAEHPYWTNNMTRKTLAALNKLNLTTIGCNDEEIPF